MGWAAMTAGDDHLVMSCILNVIQNIYEYRVNKLPPFSYGQAMFYESITIMQIA
jgi:hypothetical protein